MYILNTHVFYLHKMTAFIFHFLLLLLLLFLCYYSVNCKNEECNLYEGEWVADAALAPFYTNASCTFIQKQFDCLKNGRPDTRYLHYRWTPAHCRLPSLKGKDLGRWMKGKRVMFVGDSLGLNQWQSFVCILHALLPHGGYTDVRDGDLSTITFTSLNASVMMDRRGFLVDVVGVAPRRILRLDSVHNGSKLWHNADVLIFNTWHWWRVTGSKQRWDFIEQGGNVYRDLDRVDAYSRALETWSRWVDTYLDYNKTKVYFQGVSPDHQSCEGNTKADNHEEGEMSKAQTVLEKVLANMKMNVKLLNVTRMSKMRGDGHPSIYGYSGDRHSDCTHWCLPGVPDTWNHILFLTLFDHSFVM